MQWYKYAPREIAEAVAAGKGQSSIWRWVTLPTTHTRDYAVSTVSVLQVTYLLGVALIYCAERAAPSIEPHLLNIWLAESIANFLIRAALLGLQMNLPDPKMAYQSKWRLVPPVSAVIVGLHWAWTSTLFIGTGLTFSTFITLLVFMLITIAMIPVSAASPLAIVIYGVFLWVPATVQLARADWVGSGAFVVLFLGIVAVAIVTLAVTTGSVRRYLLKSDEVDILISKLQASNNELEGLRADAAYQLQTRSQFFSGASHDFRQRLHAMKLLTHTAEATWPGGPPSVLSKLSQAMSDLEVYVSDVLEFAQLETKASRPAWQTVHLQDIFQKLELEFEDIASERQVDLRFRVTTACFATDPTMLMRILENVVSNAIKFTRGRVLVGARPHAGGWSIEVWDKGPGIPAGTEDTIFEAFYQLSPYADPRQEGVGLGLSIVRRLARCLDYTVLVNSREGTGTVLKVLVPPSGRTNDESGERQSVSMATSVLGERT